MKEITESQLNALPLDLAEAIAFLRGEGFSKVGSIGVLAEHRGVSLSEAKVLVHTSEAWIDVRERDDRFHDELIVAVTKPT
jgi:ribosomal protein L7/L12